MNNIRTFGNVALLIGLYFLTYYIYLGILNPIPSLGDSWDYHIPIALSLLDGSFLTHPHDTIPGWQYPGTSLALQKQTSWYYPGSSESFLSLFIFLNIPLTLSNIAAILVLFASLWKLGLTFRLNGQYASLFALTFCTLNIALRWMNAISIDVWIGVWFLLGLILLENPRKTWTYFAKLGFVFGMLVGSKYSAAFYCIVLLAFYGRRLVKCMNPQRTVAFFIPFAIFGLFWYVRNYVLTGNPVYPLSHLSMFGMNGPVTFGETIWLASFVHPLEVLDAGFGEYKLWLFSAFIAAGVLMYQFVVRREFHINSMHKLFFIGLLNLGYFFFNPTSLSQVWIMVSSYRYSYPAFIPLILGVFLLASAYKKEIWIGYIVIANMINVLSMAYYPKLVFVYLPLSVVILYLLNRSDKTPSRMKA